MSASTGWYLLLLFSYVSNYLLLLLCDVSNYLLMLLGDVSFEVWQPPRRSPPAVIVIPLQTPAREKVLLMTLMALMMLMTLMALMMLMMITMMMMMTMMMAMMIMIPLQTPVREKVLLMTLTILLHALSWWCVCDAVIIFSNASSSCICTIKLVIWSELA